MKLRVLIGCFSLFGSLSSFAAAPAVLCGPDHVVGSAKESTDSTYQTRIEFECEFRGLGGSDARVFGRLLRKTILDTSIRTSARRLADSSDQSYDFTVEAQDDHGAPNGTIRFEGQFLEESANRLVYAQKSVELHLTGDSSSLQSFDVSIHAWPASAPGNYRFRAQVGGKFSRPAWVPSLLVGIAIRKALQNQARLYKEDLLRAARSF